MVRNMDINNNTCTNNHLHYHPTLSVNFCNTVSLISALLDHFKAKLNSLHNVTTSSSLARTHLSTRPNNTPFTLQTIIQQ